MAKYQRPDGQDQQAQTDLQSALRPRVQNPLSKSPNSFMSGHQDSTTNVNTSSAHHDVYNDPVVIANSQAQSAQAAHSKARGRQAVKEPAKRLAAILTLLTLLTIALGVFLYFMFKPKPAPDLPPPEPRAAVKNIEVSLPQNILSQYPQLSYPDSFDFQFANGSFLAQIKSAPQTIIFNQEVIYSAQTVEGDTPFQDGQQAVISEDGNQWAYTVANSDLAGKIVTSTGGEYDMLPGAILYGVTNAGRPIFSQLTGSQTPSQYGEALPGAILYQGDQVLMQTDYGFYDIGFKNLQPESEGSISWYAAVSSPNTTDIVDLFILGKRSATLDARSLRKIDINQQGDLMTVNCEDAAALLNTVGTDCELSVNQTTRHSVVGELAMADKLAADQAYFGLEMTQLTTFFKNEEAALLEEHKANLPAGSLKVAPLLLLSNNSSKRAVVSYPIGGMADDKDPTDRATLSINGEIVPVSIANMDSRFGFGWGEDQETLFIYTLNLESEEVI